MNKDAIIYCVINTLCIGFLFLLCVFFMSSCKTVGTVSEQVNVRDSVAIQWHDSIRWNVKDSLHIITKYVEKNDSSSLVIQFGQGGGTYNAKTGEATNVAGVSQTDTHKEKADSTAFYRSRYEDITAVADSLSQQCSEYQYQLQEERKKSRSGYDRFCSWWFWITAILLLAFIAFWICDKIPATKPYTTIIKGFFKIL